MHSKMKACLFCTMLLFPILWGGVNADENDLMWSTFLGGSVSEDGLSVAVGGDGCVYVTGCTSSDEFPTSMGAFDTSYSHGGSDAFVVKLSPYGTELAYSTFLGGGVYIDDKQEAWGIAVDNAGNAYLAGWTNTSDFPITAEAFDTTYNGKTDAFVVKLSPSGNTLRYATFLGGEDTDYGYGIAIDDTGNVYVTGSTGSADFPTTDGAFDETYNGGHYDAFVTKLNSTGSDLTYSTFLGGSNWDHGQDIATDREGDAYVTGRTASQDFHITTGAIDTTFCGYAEAFVAKIRSKGGGLGYATYLGGQDWDQGEGIAVDDAGNAYVVGHTKSVDFPTTDGAFDVIYDGAYSDAFVVKINTTASDFCYATYLGGDGCDYGHGIVLDGDGRAYVIGETSSDDFPTTPGAFDQSHNGGSDDVFITVLHPNGIALEYSTFIGGSSVGDRGNSIATNDAGCVFITGKTYSSNFPTTASAFDPSYNGAWDIFVAKLRLWDTSAGPVFLGGAQPRDYVLSQNYPNPFNASTQIRYAVPRDVHVSLKVYNVLGAKVTTLVDTVQKTGFYKILWDAEGLASGLYYCQLQAGDFEKTIKMVLMR